MVTGRSPRNSVSGPRGEEGLSEVGLDREKGEKKKRGDSIRKDLTG